MKKRVGIRAGGSLFQRLIGVDCRMENQQELSLVGVAEVSPESPPLAEQPGMPVVGIDIPLGLDVGEPVGSPLLRSRHHRPYRMMGRSLWTYMTEPNYYFSRIGWSIPRLCRVGLGT